MHRVESRLRLLLFLALGFELSSQSLPRLALLFFRGQRAGPRPWNQAMMDGIVFRASLFSSSDIKALVRHVAFVSRPRYVREHGKHR
jgi:hypothetical protein